jgi:tRNA pseudouridine38-40 synthase
MAAPGVFRIALGVEYKGSRYRGWQRQLPGVPSVQEELERALSRVAAQPVNLMCAGRTDAGVHAIAMRGHVDIEKPLTPFRLMEAINAQLRPAPIAITGCEPVAEDWHSRFACIGRSYEYRIVNRRAPLTWDKGLSWQVARPMDAGAMHAAAQQLIGLHDFTTFRSAHCQSQSPVKTLDRLSVSRHGDELIIEAAARSFLHHQVRSMVGCLAMVGYGKWSARDLKAALDAADRNALGLNAPPDGLYFVSATYP